MFNFMHPALVEINKKLEAKVEKLKDSRTWNERELKQLRLEAEKFEWKTEVQKEKFELDIEEAKNDIRKEMQQSLITSDLLRVEAVAKLTAYESMDTKADKEHINKMLEKAIDGLSKKQIVVQTKGE